MNRHGWPHPNDTLCVGKWELFDAVDSMSQYQAAKLCHACPARGWCTERTQRLIRQGNHAVARPLTGTWAGRLYGANTDDPFRFAAEEAMFTDDDAREAHAAFGRGVLNDRTRIGERVYQRRAKRNQKRAKDSGEAA